MAKCWIHGKFNVPKIGVRYCHYEYRMCCSWYYLIINFSYRTYQSIWDALHTFICQYSDYHHYIYSHNIHLSCKTCKSDNHSELVTLWNETVYSSPYCTTCDDEKKTTPKPYRSNMINPRGCQTNQPFSRQKKNKGLDFVRIWPNLYALFQGVFFNSLDYPYSFEGLIWSQITNKSYTWI